MKFFLSLLVVFCFSFGIIAGVVWHALGPVGGTRVQAVLIVPEYDDGFDLVHTLSDINVIRNEAAFRMFLLFFGPDTSVVPGGYRLHSGMNAWEISGVLSAPPQLVWVRVREGLRKEQIGELLSAKLDWSIREEDEWNAYRVQSLPFTDGIYFPDTYLLPTDETVSSVAGRFEQQFREKVLSFDSVLTDRKLDLASVLTIASLIQREAAGPHDMPLVSGVIWNRINRGMRLEIDATLQYIKGNRDAGWWPRVRSADKFVSSPYNTYRNTGLPPGPIANPGLAAIEAAMNPERTECLFYLHASDRQIYCSETYAGHLANIDAYLR